MGTSISACHVVISAGESSGDKLGAELMQALRAERSDLKISGLGGPAMIDQGLESVFPMSDISVMGVVDVLASLPKILRRINEMVDYVLTVRPDVLVLIDSQDFSKRVAKKVRKKCPETKIILYVAPKVWGWRTGRAKKMKNYIDYILSILPFEPKVFKNLDSVPCAYVGNPVINRMEGAGCANNFIKKYGISEQEKIIAIFPGSRVGEVKRLMLVYRDILHSIANELTDCRLMLPVVPHLRERLEADIALWDLPVTLIDNEEDKIGMMHAGHVALATSGTVSLELAIIGLPMVVLYKTEPIVGCFMMNILQVPSIVLPNLILDMPLISEFVNNRCRIDLVAPALTALIRNEGGIRDRQIEGLKQVKQRLQLSDKASYLAAHKILEVLS